MSVLAQHLCQLEEAHEANRETRFLQCFATDRVFYSLEVADFPARQIPASGLGRASPLDEQNPPLRHDRSAAAYPDLSLAHAAKAARMRAQERAPL